MSRRMEIVKKYGHEDCGEVGIDGWNASTRSMERSLLNDKVNMACR